MKFEIIPLKAKRQAKMYKNEIIVLTHLELVKSGFEQPGPGIYFDSKRNIKKWSLDTCIVPN